MIKNSVARKPPRRPTTIVCSRSHCHTMDEQIEEAPPDPTSSKSDVDVQCLLREIDETKLIHLINGHPSARTTSLILQALRQQMSVATLEEYVLESLDWMISHDILMMKMKKNSLYCRILQAEGVDSREQMARLVNTMASYTNGRHFFTTHHKTFLPCLIAVLRGKRLPSSTHDQLIACVQKMSIRTTCQKELITSGMLEWAVNHLDQKLNNYAFEYLAAMIVNLSTNSLCSPLLTRLADSIANSIASLIFKVSHGPSCSLYNTLLLSALSCSRIRLRAKDTKLLEAIKYRLESRKSCPLCNLHVPYLIAIVNQEIEYNRVPNTPTDGDTDKAGNSCEREIDSLDPLRPSTNELSGARLLIRKAYKDHSSSDMTLVPGEVPYNKSSSKNPVTSRKNGTKPLRKTEPRIGTATSQHTFVIETERRRPLMINIGLSEGAVEYKKKMDEIEKKRKEEQSKIRKEKEEKEKERQKTLRHIQLTSRKAPSLLRKELSETGRLEDKIEKLTRRKTAGSRLSNASKYSSLSNQSISGQSIPQKNTVVHENQEKNNNRTPSPKLETESQYYSAENASFEDYSAIFGSRPKVARTPEQQSRSFF